MPRSAEVLWTPRWPGDFPSLGYMQIEWVEQHCVVPDGFRAGKPFEPTNEQATFLIQHYRLKPSAELGQLAPAFRWRRSQLVRPQKWGKGPLTAAQICLEAVGPALFGGWAQGGEVWDCRDHRCGCGWVYQYEPGEPMALAWPTPLIQVTATSEDQTDNIYGALRPMIDRGPLHEAIPKTGEEFIRTPGGGRIDVVTSNATSRLGQRLTFAPQDETGLWTKSNGMVKVAQTQRRGAAGMGGRTTETTNGWDPSENSVAQMTAESKATDIYRDHRLPPAHLKYKNKRDRDRIHRHVYGDSFWVDLDAIEAEALELLETDPAQAERFFGNRSPSGGGAAFDVEHWKTLHRPDWMPPKGDLIVIGVDGARYNDALAVVATSVVEGFQWPLGIWERPEGAEDDYEHPFAEIDAVMVDAFERWQPWRIYIDPQYIDHLVDAWCGRWSTERVKAWTTNRPRPIAHALRSYRAAQTSGDLSHNGDSVFTTHIGNARRQTLKIFDDDHRPMWGIKKETPHSALKIDGAMAGCLSWECRGDAIASGAKKKSPGVNAYV